MIWSMPFQGMSMLHHTIMVIITSDSPYNPPFVIINVASKSLLMANRKRRRRLEHRNITAWHSQVKVALFQADLVTLVAMLLKSLWLVVPFLLSDRNYDHHTHTPKQNYKSKQKGKRLYIHTTTRKCSGLTRL